ncbi:MAG: glycosyltransferase family 4 protein, partial [Bacteroidetes bacterium]|nr:glycosyltransferase family 4 protein [Bacteroidota bacterium]
MNFRTNHIAILCSRLDLPGGIEKAIINLANELIKQGWKITIIILDETNKRYYPLNDNVSIRQLNLSFGITQEGNIITRKIRLLSDVLKLRKVIKETDPGHIIGTEYPFTIAAVLTGAGKKASLYAWEHHHLFELRKSLFWDKAFQLAYSRLKAIISLNEDEQVLYKKINRKSVVIPNFIIPDGSTHKTFKKRILTIARLTNVKGIDLLLPVAKEVLIKNSDWQWKIIGDGEMKELVLNFISENKLEKQLILQTPKNHMLQQEYLDASLYVMTSRNECFPMTLLEAQSAGLPCIAFDCDTGPRHIIIPGVNGLLVEKENTADLAEAISSLMKNE